MTANGRLIGSGGRVHPERVEPQADDQDVAPDFLERVKCFHAPDGKAYATVPVYDHFETFAVKSDDFKRWLRCEFYTKTGASPDPKWLRQTIDDIEAKALFGSPKCDVFMRVAETSGGITIDLLNEAREAVEITTHGWKIVSHSPVKFRRPPGMAAMPRPVAGGVLNDLRPFLNAATASSWILAVVWMTAALRGKGPYPILAIQGGQGAGKSATARILRSLLDPNTVPLRWEPRNAHALMISSANTRIQVLDNLSAIPVWLSNVLCQASTGGGFATRRLFKDSEEELFKLICPTIVTGIEDLIIRPDLLSRTIVLRLPEITSDRRRTEEELMAEFETAAPAIFGALLTIVSRAMAILPTVQLDSKPRMADFARWGVAVEKAMDWPAGTFLQAYESNLEEAVLLPLEATPACGAVQKLMANRNDWVGTATQLLEALETIDWNSGRRHRPWPANPKALSDSLRVHVPNLRAVGLDVEFARAPGHDRTRLITIRREEAPAPSDARDARDARDTAPCEARDSKSANTPGEQKSLEETAMA